METFNKLKWFCDDSDYLSASQILTVDLIQSARYTDKKMEAQHEEGTCPRSHSKLEDLGPEPKSLLLRPRLSPLHTLVMFCKHLRSIKNILTTRPPWLSG